MKAIPSLKILIISLFIVFLSFTMAVANHNSNTNHIKSNNDNFNSVLVESNAKLKLKAQVNAFIEYFNEYSKIEISDGKINAKYNSHKTSSEKKNVDPDKLYAYYNKKKSHIFFESEKITSQKEHPLIAQGIYYRTRFQTGWDKLNIHTFSTVNPLIQCWTAGFIEGMLTSDEIYAYYKNIHVFFYRQEILIRDIKNFYATIDNNLKEKISLSNFQKLRDSIDDDSTPGVLKHWSYITCLHAQLNGLLKGYNRIAEKEKKLDLFDMYFINSEGNFEDLKTFMKINKMKIDNPKKFYTTENLMKMYNTANIEQIWKKLTRQGHCSALIKILEASKTSDGKYDILAGHNTWSDYCELLRTMKYVEFDFEGESRTVGMNPRQVSFSSYPGVLFSGDDFYELDSKVVILQTTLSSLNRFCYKNIINMDLYIPEFMRIMITNFMSSSGKEWVENYKSYRNHMYITQWLVIDYNVLDKINNEKEFLSVSSNRNGLIHLVEEVPGSIKSQDISEITLSQGYFGSFNIAHFPEHLEILGLTHFSEIGFNFQGNQYNPRDHILQHFQNDVKDLSDFQKIISYNGFHNPQSSFPEDPSLEDPSNGISARDDLLYFHQVFHGGIDFKIVNKDLVRNMTIFVYGGPTYGNNPNILPFDFDTVKDYHSKYHHGIPKVWNFSPFYFSKRDFTR